jgi:elongation of very long chain fatty acids protein 7
LPSVIICFSYFYFAKVWGPKFMKNRQAYDLRGVLLVYNVFQILSNSWIFYELGRYGWLSGNYSFICQPVDYSNSEAALRILRASYWFYITKFIDFFDTLFFVLRKKNNQITTLHVLHHGLLPMNIWPGLRFTAGGHASFFAFLNALVHIVMYFYYFLSAMGPSVQKYLGWKKYLTTFQMIQFVAASIHCFQLIFVDCDFPIGFCWWIGCQELLFLCLFIKFYKDTYVKKKRITRETISRSPAIQRKKKNQ